MFAGVGCFSILIAKAAEEVRVFSIDVNPTAAKFMEENVRINGLYGKVFPIIGDSKEIVNTQLQQRADRVLMPLPEKAIEYLPYAVRGLKPSGGWIHFYDFQHATRKEDPTYKTKQKVAQVLGGLNVGCSFVFSRVVRSTGPNWYQTVLDILVDKAPSKF
jgi:tRNA (guanine37-N1)-methyltransferase